MDCLGIEKEEVEKVLIKGMKWKEEKIEKWHANAYGIEIVFVRNDEEIFIIQYMKTEE